MRRKWIALAALALLAAGGVWAQSVVQDGQSTRQVQQSALGGHLVRSDSTQDANTGDGNGNLYVTEANPDQTFLVKHSFSQATLYHTYGRMASTTTLKGPQHDSTAAVSMLGCNRMALALRYTLDDSSLAALAMVEVRGHITANTDSTSTFIWYGGFASAAGDTVGTTRDLNKTALNDTTTGVGGEFPVWLNQTGVFRHKWIPLQNRDTGEWFAAPFVSVRIRIIRTYGASMAANVGATSPPTSVQMDLVGWR